MKALTLTQPWATLVALGLKKIETRSWGSSYRGPLAIHAAKGLGPVGGHSGLIDLCLNEPFRSTLAEHGLGLLVPGEQLPLGMVVATARLLDVLPIVSKPERGKHCVAPDDEGLMRVWHPIVLGGRHGHSSDMTTEHEQDFGDYTPGRYAWVLGDIKALAEPVPARGSLGLWNWANP